MLVAAQVSSINTSFSRSIAGCASLHARRAACTSARSCSLACRVFFEGQIPLVQLVPKSADPDGNPLRCQPLLQLGQSQPGYGSFGLLSLQWGPTRKINCTDPCRPVQHPCRIRAARPALDFVSTGTASCELDLHKIGLDLVLALQRSSKLRRARSQADIGSCETFPGGCMRAAYCGSSRVKGRHDEGAGPAASPRAIARMGKEAARQLGRGAPQER